MRSARAMKVFGDLVNDESSLCYSPSPSKARKGLGLRNITNMCNSSPSQPAPFGSFELNKKKTKKSSVSGTKKEKNKSELEATKKPDKVTKTVQIGERNPAPAPSHAPAPAPAPAPKANKNMNQRTKDTSILPKKRAIHKSTKMSPPKKHINKSKFRSNASSIKRQAQASKAQRAIRQATESVNQTLNATRVAKIDHHRNVAEQVALLREEWIAEKEEAARFYAEVAKTKKEMIQLRSQLSAQYAQNKADTQRERYQQRLNELDREIKFKSDVFVEHKRKLKENEDRRRRLSTQKKDNIFRERRDATVRIEMERIEEEHDHFERKWAGEEDAKEYLRECEKERRESFAFRNSEGVRQRKELAEQKAQEKNQEHEGFELKWAGEEDAKEYLRQCDISRRESFAFRNTEGKNQRNEEEERNALEKVAEHKSYLRKWAGEKDAEKYLEKCKQERRDSFAFRNAEGRKQRAAEAERNEDMQIAQHEGHERKWAGEEGAKAYLRQCELRRRDSFAFRNAEGSRQRLEEEEREVVRKLAEHDSYELKWAGEEDAKEYRKRCEKARRESLALRGRECMHHKAVMEELQSIAKEKEHEYYVLKWAAQDDVKEYLGKVAEHRRNSLAFRNQEGKRHRALEEEWRCEELQKEHEIELARSACKSLEM